MKEVNCRSWLFISSAKKSIIIYYYCLLFILLVIYINKVQKPIEKARARKPFEPIE